MHMRKRLPATFRAKGETQSCDKTGTTLRENATHHARQVPKTPGHLVEHRQKTPARLSLCRLLELGKATASPPRQGPAACSSPNCIAIKTARSPHESLNCVQLLRLALVANERHKTRKAAKPTTAIRRRAHLPPCLIRSNSPCNSAALTL